MNHATSNTTAVVKSKRHAMPRRTTWDNIGRLKTLAKQIRDGHEATEGFIKSSTENARSALGEAIITGNALLQAKQINGHGNFEGWLKEHCKGISKSTCQRYMKIARTFGSNKSHVTEMPSGFHGHNYKPTVHVTAFDPAIAQFKHLMEPERRHGTPSGSQDIPDGENTILESVFALDILD